MTPPQPRQLPQFPWDTLTESAEQARAHPDGVVNLSVGTPVDPVDPRLRQALAAVADQPGYPTTHGTFALRQAVVGALWRRHGIRDVPVEAVLPTIGSKELVAWLPTLLSLQPGDVVAIPELAYPTYAVGASLAGAEVVRLKPGELAPQGTKLWWLNSPSNPTGRVDDASVLTTAVRHARAIGCVLAADECYVDLGWDAVPMSVLHPSVCGGSFAGLLALHSLSKSSNLAGYRAGYVTGDPELVRGILEVRKHAGMIVPRPVQEAITTALSEDEHVRQQRARYQERRHQLRPALEAAGFRIDDSQGGLYLWATRGEPAWDTVDWLAERGILVAPGTFYGPAGGQHVRVALTATDERIAAAVARLS